jgi:hypothetical protein
LIESLEQASKPQLTGGPLGPTTMPAAPAATAGGTPTRAPANAATTRP